MLGTLRVGVSAFCAARAVWTFWCASTVCTVGIASWIVWILLSVCIAFWICLDSLGSFHCFGWIASRIVWFVLIVDFPDSFELFRIFVLSSPIFVLTYFACLGC